MKQNPQKLSTRVTAVILAGGEGLRLWPLSTQKKPKQFCQLFSEQTMLQLTVQRILGIISIERIFIVTCLQYLEFVEEQIPNLPQNNIIVEPESRDTFSAIGYAAISIEKKIPGAIMLVLASDQYINPIERFHDSILHALEIAEQGNYLVSVGVIPTEPNIQYGYMECECDFDQELSPGIYRGNRYVEKPNLEIAKYFVQAGNYLWNTNIFIWKISTLLNAYKFYQFNNYQILREIQSQLDYITPEKIAEKYKRLDKISIDYGILEKVKYGDLYQHIFIAGTFSWSDLGNFPALTQTMPHDNFDNYYQGIVKQESSSNCILIAKPPYTLKVLEVTDLIVVIGSEGDLLVTNYNSVGQIKEFLINEVFGNKQDNKIYSLHTNNLDIKTQAPGIICTLNIQDIKILFENNSVHISRNRNYN